MGWCGWFFLLTRVRLCLSEAQEPEHSTAASLSMRAENRNESGSKHSPSGPGAKSGRCRWSYGLDHDRVKSGTASRVSTVGRPAGNSPTEPGLWQVASLETLTQS